MKKHQMRNGTIRIPLRKNEIECSDCYNICIRTEDNICPECRDRQIKDYKDEIARLEAGRPRRKK